MSEQQTHEERVIIESPVHGPAIIAELRRLQDREQEILEAWGVDDHEARELRFALFDIENGARASGNMKLAEMAQRARVETVLRAHKEIADLLLAVENAIDGDGRSQEELLSDLDRAFKPFRERKA